MLTVGGTGVGATDVTVEAIEPLLDKRLPGSAIGRWSVPCRVTRRPLDSAPSRSFWVRWTN
ncbi:MAG: molybdopterin-binding protein [Halorhabdus sp.]